MKTGVERRKGARQTNSQMPVLRKKILKITDIHSKKEVYPLFNAQCREAPRKGLIQALLGIERAMRRLKIQLHLRSATSQA